MRRTTRITLVLASMGWVAEAAEPATERTTPGALEARLGEGTRVELPLRHTDVRVEISAFLARTTVEQVFANPYTEPIEALYTFPLGDQAAVDDFELQDTDRNHVPLDAGRCIHATPGNRFPVASVAPGDPGYNPAHAPGDGSLDDCSGDLSFDPGDDIGLERPDGALDLYVQNPGWGSVFYLGNGNRIDYEAYVLELERRLYRNWEIQSSYTWSEAIGDGEDYRQALGDDRTLAQDERGHQAYDQRHVFKVAAVARAPWGLRFGGSVSWQSGLPYSILSRRFVFDAISPELAGLGAHGAGRARTTYPSGGRNSERNASWWDCNVKVTKEFRLGRGVNGQASIEVLNLLDDGTYQVLSPFTESGRQINGNDDAVRRFGREWQLGLRLAF